MALRFVSRTAANLCRVLSEGAARSFSTFDNRLSEQPDPFGQVFQRKPP